MTLRQRVRWSWRAIAGGRALDVDLDEELRAAVDDLAARHRRNGVNEPEARRRALIELGGVEQVKEAVRDVRVGHALDLWLVDLRQAWRGVWRVRTFAVAVIGTLALGIGAHASIFTVVNAMLLEPLPYAHARRLVLVWADYTQAGYPRGPLAGPELRDLRARARSFEALGGIWANTAALTGDGDPEHLRIGLVTSNFFSVLGADAALGRTFAAADEARTAPAAILLSHQLWTRRYGADAAIVGRRILVNAAPTTVIGVMPAGFRLWMPADANVPDDLQAWALLPRSFLQWPRGQQFLRVVGRLRPGVTLEEASAEVAAIGRQITREFTDYAQSAPQFYAVGLQADGVREIRPSLLVLFGGVTLLLLIACVNVANLLVARAAGRRRELAMRVALGAGRRRLVRQSVLEGILLGAIGGVAGLAVAMWGLEALLALTPDALDRITTARIDARVVAVTVGGALLWGLLFSLASLAEVLRAEPTDVMHESSRVAGSRLDARVRSTLVLLQISVSVVLLVSSALLVRAFVRLQRVDVGFNTEDTLTFRVALPGNRYRSGDAVNAFSREFLQRLRQLPGVISAGAVSHLPYDNLPNWSTPYIAEGAADRRTVREADARAITPGYFETIGARLTRGRLFSEADDPSHPFVAIVDESLAARLWPGEDPLGKRLITDPQTTGSMQTPVVVVGVVRHLRHRTPAQHVREQIYYAERQVFRSPMAYLLKGGGDYAQRLAGVRRTLGAMDSQLPIFDVRPMEDYVHGARGVRRFTTVLAALFAAVAVLLAAIGIYGVLAYSVTRRRQEFGIRQALGATPSRVCRLVARDALRLTSAGAAIGLVLAAFVARVIEGQLFGVTARDPLSYASAVIVLAAAVGMAIMLPARRAAAANVLESLRAE